MSEGAGSPPVALDALRQQVIERLSFHFAQDALTVDDLEARIERAYQARDEGELHSLVADLERSAQPVRVGGMLSGPVVQDLDRLVNVMGDTKRRGPWVPARRIELLAIMSETTLDFTEALIGSGVTEIHLTAVMASVRIIVPPGLHVVNAVSAFMATVSETPYWQDEDLRSAPVIHLSGSAVMAEVSVRPPKGMSKWIPKALR
ncbi:MAG: hypothetical protein JWO05_2155 [Gemmatimonadetes bacterium]|nr:hypothetical protein [Gemmatimonadota bacterium]